MSSVGGGGGGRSSYGYAGGSVGNGEKDFLGGYTK